MLSTKRKPTRYAAHVVPERERARVRILCAADLTSASEHAIRRALQLADLLDGEVLLLHVVENDIPLRLAGRRADRARTALQWHLRQFPQARIVPQLSVRIGHPYATIARAAKNWDADLIVLGAHRRTTAKKLRLSAAERIAERSLRPVLVVNSESSREYGGVVFVARKKIGSCVQVADRFELFSTAHVAVMPRVSFIDRAICMFAGYLHHRAPELAARMQRALHRSSRRVIEDAGLHLMGFELVNERPTPHAVMARLKRSKGPQLLVAGLGRSSFFNGSLARSSAILALRSRACDVLIVSDAAARRVLRAPSFTLPNDACESTG